MLPDTFCPQAHPRHCTPRRWPLPCNLPLPFPLYSQFGLYCFASAFNSALYGPLLSLQPQPLPSAMAFHCC